MRGGRSNPHGQLNIYSPIEDAWRRNLPVCPKCKAGLGDPCRMPSDKSTKAHKEREEISVSGGSGGKVAL